jgi:hypothetical protein
MRYIFGECTLDALRYELRRAIRRLTASVDLATCLSVDESSRSSPARYRTEGPMGICPSRSYRRTSVRHHHLHVGGSPIRAPLAKGP